eukprot:CAMPEP_0119398392 /NCGR_PEP_ID=MMETSP1334-20130426/140820_1 /TAXON_ID=127549 /ORGANISM="Calcidiscus leptoporus, Strain RCC1130" /LENGTH=76 /DNA_ID=CAMNT_0007422251 /DNA_START=1046 /DNA_END=1273 /DNA_ORIENTATION=+
MAGNRAKQASLVLRCTRCRLRAASARTHQTILRGAGRVLQTAPAADGAVARANSRRAWTTRLAPRANTTRQPAVSL